MTSQSLIDELTASCAEADIGRRAAILARLTNLFISGRSAYDEQQIALFDDVPVRLSEQVEIVARARLAERLAAISNPPNITVVFFPKISESMGNHDSNIVDAGSVD